MKKTNALVCTPGYIRGKWSDAAYKTESHQRGSNFQGEEAGEDKLHNMRSDSSVEIPERKHGKATC